jgi:hypothetical protein
LFVALKFLNPSSHSNRHGDSRLFIPDDKKSAMFFKMENAYFMDALFRIHVSYGMSGQESLLTESRLLGLALSKPGLPSLDFRLRSPARVWQKIRRVKSNF